MNSTSAAEDSAQLTMARRSVVSGMIGTIIEWYDFMIFASMAATVFDVLFFTSASPTVAMIASLGTFAVGLLARPIGGIVLGHFGDRVGRKKVLVWSLTMMGVATTMIGLLPTYSVIGIAAPLLLTVLRIVQGFAIGGEFASATTIVLEHAPAQKRGFYAGFIVYAAPVGFVLGLLTVIGLRTALTPEQFLSWGWRIPFLASVLLLAVGAYLRLRVVESDTFGTVAESGPTRIPIVHLLRTQWHTVLQTFFMHLSTTTLAFVLATFLLSYATLTGIASATSVMIALAVSNTINLTFIWTVGRLADRYGRRRIFIVGSIAQIVTAFPLFWLFDTGVFILIVLGLLLSLIAQYLCAITEASFYTELFPPEVRVTGGNFGYQMANAVGGGLAPVAAVGLLEWSGGNPWSVSVLLVAVGAVSLIAGLTARETRPRSATSAVPSLRTTIGA